MWSADDPTALQFENVFLHFSVTCTVRLACCCGNTQECAISGPSAKAKIKKSFMVPTYFKTISIAVLVGAK
jgi:hypothetical protein